MPSPLRLIKNDSGGVQELAKPRVTPATYTSPRESDNVFAGASGHGSKKSGTHELLKELNDSSVLHHALLKELRDICSHLRVDIKADIAKLLDARVCDGAENVKAAWLTPAPASHWRQGAELDFLPNALHLEDAVVDTAAEGLEVSDLNEVNEANFLADDLTDEVKGRSRAAWPESREVSKKSAKSQANTNRTAESSKDGRSAWSQDSRMPPYPSGRRKYLSSVDLYQALQAQQGASWPERIVTHDYFDYVMGLILMLNAILVGIQVDVASQLPSDPIWSRAIDLIFCLIFVLELVLRVSAFGQTFLNMEGWQWNLFDLLIVGFSVADEATKLILSDGEVQEVFDSFGVLRLLRLGRIVRLVRMVRLMPALKSMVYLILASLKSFLWTVVLLLILMYCVAVYFTELAFDLQHKHPDKDFSSVRQSWGSIGSSILSLFQAITGGDDWQNFILVFRDVSGESSLVNTLVFSLFIAFATLVMMNLVTGVFVDGAQRIAREEKNQELLKHVRRLLAPQEARAGRFSTAPRGGDDDLVTWLEFCQKLQTEEMSAYLTAFEMDAGQAKDIFYILDQERQGKVTMREFFSACVNLHGAPRLADTAILRHLVQRTFEELDSHLDRVEALLGGSAVRDDGAAPKYAHTCPDFHKPG